jgi:DNA-binding MurR/RpiR family transcriptional regulator
MPIAEQLAAAAERFSPAERRVAEVVASDPHAVAFGTVAELARRSRTSGPTVVRFAARLGFSGFVDLQAAAQDEIADALRPAAARIRERPATDVVGQALTADVENVRSTLEAVDADEFAAAVALLGDQRRPVFVLAGEIAHGAGESFVTQLDLLREGVTAVSGSPVRVSRQVAQIGRDAVVVAIEHRRYERWLIETLARTRTAGADVIAVTDSALSPVATGARATFAVSARGVGPFDSYVGTMSLLHALLAGVAARLRKSATARLDAVEAAWTATNELIS